MFASRFAQFLAWVVAIFAAGRMALEIRMYAIKTYGPVIHEFDPWFNYRATEYVNASVNPAPPPLLWCIVPSVFHSTSATPALLHIKT